MPKKPWIGAALLALPILLLCAQACSSAEFEKSEVMIPMRDGVKLHTVIFTPKDHTGPLPILFERTPYSATSDARDLAATFEYLIADGYIFAIQDIRGRFQSEGEFVMLRTPRNRARPERHR